MKKTISIILSALLAVGMSACTAAPAGAITGSNSASAGHVGGVIADASMNTVTVNCNDGTVLTFGTEDADKAACNGLETGTALWVYYTGSIDYENSDASQVKVTRMVQTEEQSCTGTVNEDTSMSLLQLDKADGGSIAFTTIPTDTSKSGGLTIGSTVTVYFAENPDASDENVVVAARIEAAEASAPAAPAADEQFIKGIITDAAMNSLLVHTSDDAEYLFITEDTDKTKADGLLLGSAVWVYYTGELTQDGPGIASLRIEQPAEKALEGKVSADSTMHVLTVETADGALSFSTQAADMSKVNGLVEGTSVRLTYAGELGATFPQNGDETAVLVRVESI